MNSKERAYKKSSLIRYFCSLVILVTASLITASCSKRYQDLPTFVGIPFEDSYNYSVGRFKTSYMADQIHAYFRGNISGPIAVTTFVEIDNLYQSSTFGRIMAEQLISELSMRGYNVIEIRMSDAVQIMENEGELGLSRDVGSIKGQQNLSGLVVGTYAASPDRVYVNSRLIDPRTSKIVSVGSVEMKKTEEIAMLLRGNSFPTSLERIPVKHLSLNDANQLPVYLGQMGSSSFGMNAFGDELAKKLAVDTPLLEAPIKKTVITPGKDEVKSEVSVKDEFNAGKAVSK